MPRLHGRAFRGVDSGARFHPGVLCERAMTRFSLSYVLDPTREHVDTTRSNSLLSLFHSRLDWRACYVGVMSGSMKKYLGYQPPSGRSDRERVEG